MKHLDQLRAALTEKETALVALTEKDSLTAEEVEALGKLPGEIESLETQIKTLEDAQRAAMRLKGKSPDGGDKVEPTVRQEPGKFKSLGEQLQAIVRAEMNKGSTDARDPRLVWQMIKAAGANEAIPSEGGFLVQTDFSTSLLSLMHEMGSVVSRVTTVPISANSNGIKLPTIDETSRVDGSRWGGLRAYWANEGDTVTATKPKLAEIELRLHKLMGLGYMTEELMADATAMEAIFRQGFAEEITFKTEDAIINGDGSGKPLGILNSGALITVNPESGQAAATLRAVNVLNMLNRVPARNRRNAVWLINQDAEPQLWQMELGSQGTHLYAPPGVNGQVLANAPFGTLVGRPVLPVEYCASVGTVGDIILADLSQYLMIDKGGVQTAESIHVRFIYDEMAFRITYRVDGQPSWRTAKTPFKGSVTQSPFVALGSR